MLLRLDHLHQFLQPLVGNFIGIASSVSQQHFLRFDGQRVVRIRVL
jgi:hypothetical protein